MGLCADVPDPPEPPRTVNPLEILGANLFFNRQNTESPFGRQEYGSYDDEGNWVAFDSASYGQAYAAFLQDALDGDDQISPQSIEMLLSATPTEARMLEDPRLRAIREQGQEADSWRQQIGMGYLGQFGGSPQGLPESQYGVSPGQNTAGPGTEIGGGFNIPQLPDFPTASALPSDLSAYRPWETTPLPPSIGDMGYTPHYAGGPDSPYGYNVPISASAPFIAGSEAWNGANAQRMSPEMMRQREALRQQLMGGG